ncbi:MAG: MarR family winged helix-turn-helix transcriptional regulator [Betaproteobacteria bacterium]
MRIGKTSSAPTSEVPFIADYLPALMAQAHALMAHEFHEIVRSRGFTVSEWRILASLAGRGPVPIGRLAQFVVMKQPTVTRVLDRQEARGEVKRIGHKTDRRITLVSITPKGTRLVAELIEQAREHEARILQPLGGELTVELKASLRQIIAMNEPPGGIALADLKDA